MALASQWSVEKSSATQGALAAACDGSCAESFEREMSALLGLSIVVRLVKVVRGGAGGVETEQQELRVLYKGGENEKANVAKAMANHVTVQELDEVKLTFNEVARLREPPKSMTAMAFLISTEPKMEGAMDRAMRS